MLGQLAMTPSRLPLLPVGAASIAAWLFLWALLDFAFWFVGATFLMSAILFAWRIDAITRAILRRRGKGHQPPEGPDEPPQS